MTPFSSVTAAVHFLQHDLRAEQVYLVAVSGGRDSMMLLHLLLSAGYKRLVVCHLNHALRGRESGQDAAWVRRMAGKLGLACEIEKVEVGKLARDQRQSVETAGREVRYAFLNRMAAKHQATGVFLAHHADDQAETIIANWCRGAGIRGLSGMRAESRSADGLRLLRPLLQVRRSEIDAYVAAHGLAFREDSSNDKTIHRRNAVRHRVLPLLNQVFKRDVAPLVCRSGIQAARDDDFLVQSADSFLKNHEKPADAARLKITPELRALHPAILSRVLTRWLKDSLRLPGIDFEVIEAAVTMLKPGGPAKINLPGDRHLRRKAGELFVIPG